MSIGRIFEPKLFLYCLYASIISACFQSIVEVFQATMFSRMGYLSSSDIFIIFISLFIIYSMLWLICLTFIAFSIKKYFENISLLLSLPCISFFLYQLFWIVSNTLEANSYLTVYGLFHSIFLIVFSALSTGALYTIIKALNGKGYLKNFGLNCLIFALASILYLMTYIHFKTSAGQENFTPIYSIALLAGFLIILVSMVLLSNKVSKKFRKFDNTKARNGIKIILIFIPMVSFMTYFAFSAFSQNKNDLSKPNILFISIDTLRADHVSLYDEIGKQTSPNLDKIAKLGYSFQKAYSTSSWTLPSHATMMTGLFPSSHHADRSEYQTIRQPVDPLPSSAVTLAEILKENGYQTAGIISNPFVSSSFGMNQGFDFFDDRVDLFENIKYLSLKDTSMIFRALKNFKIIEKNDYDGERQAIDVNKKAFNWLTKIKKDDKPFFLFLHYNEPHYPYEPPWPYNKKSNGKPLEYFRDIEKLMDGFFSLSSYGLTDLINLYDGEISYLDYQLGAIFKYFENSQQKDNTLIVITADHGESFNEHEIWQHGNRLYQEQIRIPLIFSFPKLIPSNIIDKKNIVQLTDIMPTILDVLKINIPNHIQGRSLLPIFSGSSDKTFSFAFSEIKPDIRWKTKNDQSGIGMKSIIHNNWKYILSDNGHEELYDIDTDTQENNNLIGSDKDTAEAMKKLLNTFYHSVALNKAVKSEIIDSGRLEQLRQLGYVK